MRLHSTAMVHRNRLQLVFAMTGLYMVVEFVAGVLTGSLALVADAAHMLTDTGALGLALFAVRLAERPPDPKRTYGYYRAEILAALTNALILMGIGVYVLYEAWLRFREPPEINVGAMVPVAVIGLVVNLIGAVLLASGARHSLNLRGAYFEVLSDMVSSLGVLLAGVVMLWTRAYWVDPLVSVGIALFIVPRSWRLLREAAHVLMEGVPPGIRLTDIEQTLREGTEVLEVHDLHVWSLTSGVNAMSAHVVVQNPAAGARVLDVLKERMRRRYGIQHVTLQFEAPDSLCPEKFMNM